MFTVHRPANPPNRLFLFVALALFCVRITDAHAHLCLDGQEPPLAVHVEDLAGAHESGHADEAHDDVDVSVIADAAPKKAEDSAQPDVLLQVTASVLLPDPALSWRAPADRGRRILLASFPPLFQPPARGPPR